MRIIVIGLGYVGLPLAVQLAKHFETWGLDINQARIDELKSGFDRTDEIDRERLTASSLRLTTDAADCPPADAYIVTVPTPIDADNKPDLSPVIGATKMVGSMIKAGQKPVIIYESTVYPGVTEDICGPLLEQVSGFKHHTGFSLGYSPERINPGDREHTVDKITKVIAGDTPAVTETLAQIYGKVTSGGVFRAASIKAAEAAKVIENAQRDINIAFMNEVTQIFAKMDLSIWDVLDAAKSKWNFMPFQPGLVGGHCIGVDPYYLAALSEQVGHHPEVILAGRRLNDRMAAHIATAALKLLVRRGGDIMAARIGFLGITFKENVPDIRNSKAIDRVRELQSYALNVMVHDPVVTSAEAAREGIVMAGLDELNDLDLLILTVPHEAYLTDKSLLNRLAAGGILMDVKSVLSRRKLPEGCTYWSL